MRSSVTRADSPRPVDRFGSEATQRGHRQAVGNGNRCGQLSPIGSFTVCRRRETRLPDTARERVARMAIRYNLRSRIGLRSRKYSTFLSRWGVKKAQHGLPIILLSSINVRPGGEERRALVRIGWRVGSSRQGSVRKRRRFWRVGWQPPQSVRIAWRHLLPRRARFRTCPRRQSVWKVKRYRGKSWRGEGGKLVFRIAAGSRGWPEETSPPALP